MNSQLVAAANLGILTVIFFIAGIIKPKVPLFFMANPTRFLVVVITTIMIMVVGTLYGEGMRLTKIERAVSLPAPVLSTDAVPTANEIPSTTGSVPAPAPQPAPAK